MTVMAVRPSPIPSSILPTLAKWSGEPSNIGISTPS
jgi:hypothetical protein